MLAIKECLIREGVLNLDSSTHGSSSHRHFQLQSSKSSGNMDMSRYSKTFAASSDLSSASATAKTSCQQQAHQLQKEEQQPSDESIGSISRGSYRGQHPHFHHHTTPAYYTDLQLRIHTPNASDIGVLNENYQSVYSTPSTQLIEQRCFPKSSTATVAPPPIAGHAQTNQRSSFFRLGDSVSTDNNNCSGSCTIRRPRSSTERCAKSLPPSVNPIKGEGSTKPVTQRIQAQSPQNFIACSSSSCRSPIAQASKVGVLVAGTVGSVGGSNSSRNSRHTQRFQHRSKRAVRVRSESRPISALYDIICKEKGLDVGNSTTSSSSNSSSNEEQPQPQASQQQKQLSKSDTLATFWPLHHQYHRPSMSSVNSNQQSEQLDRRQQLTKQKRIQTPADAGSADDDNDDDSPYALHSSQKTTDLTVGKANSLPPTDSMSSYLMQGLPQPQPMAVPVVLPTQLLKEPPLPVASSTSQQVMGGIERQPISTDRLFVEPPKLSLPELNLRVNNKNQLEAEKKKEELKSPVYEQGEVFETLARWQQELSSTIDKSAQLLNGANGHHHYPYQREHHHYDLTTSPALDQLHTVAIEDHHPEDHHPQSQSQPNHHQHHQATNARRFITRTTRSGSRQSAGHSSPLPPTGYHSDSSYNSPSPTRKHHPAATTTASVSSFAAEEAAIATGTDPQSSANGNSSAYETAATTVMTHAKPAPEQLNPQPTEVPKSASPPSQANAKAVITLPAAVNSASHKSVSSKSASKRSINFTCNNNNNNTSSININKNTINRSRFCRNNNNSQLQQQKQQHLNVSHDTSMPPLATPSNKAPLIVLKAEATTTVVTTTATSTATSSSPSKRRKNLLSPLRIVGALGNSTNSNHTPNITSPQASPLLSSSSSSPQSSPAVRTTKASRLRAAALDRKKEDDQQQQQVRPRYSSPNSLRTNSTPPARRLSSSELSPKCNSGFSSEPSGSVRQHSIRSASQPTENIERRPLVATANNVSMKQNLSELHFSGGILSPPKAECTLLMRPRSSTLCAETENESESRMPGKPRDNLTNLQLSPVQKHKRTPEASPLPGRCADRDKSAKRKSNLNRSYNEEATKDSDEAASTRRRRRRELGMTRSLIPGDDESLRELLQSPQKSSCSESTSKSESLHQARGISQKLNERTKTELAEFKMIPEQAQVAGNKQHLQDLKMSPILRRKSTDELATAAMAGASTSTQNSPPAPNQIVSILKKKEHAFGECNSSASSNASPVTFSATVLDTPLPSSRSKRQGILKKRSSLDESRYYSRSHSPDERSILIKSARRNSLEEAGSALSPGQAHGILKQSSYESTKSDGCPSANESQPHSILKKKDSLSTPSDGGAHISKHVSISQAVTLAAAELAAHDDIAAIEDGEEHEIRPILKQESTSSEEAPRPPKPILKKKSFGEADEHEIRPILKSSRKSSREEFDLGELTQDAVDSAANEASGMRPILKTDSPSKRRSLGSTQQPAIDKINSSSLLKRRTHSLERQDAPPVMDLAAALDAITNSQVVTTPIMPVDFVTTPSNISVAERIKHMEMLSTPSTHSAGSGGINSSWESPLQHAPHLHDSGAGTRLLKPSVLRRDLYKDRYKTQPITSEEKSFFKANSTPFDISTTSAFKPTRPLDICIGAQLQQQQQPLISPITGQPLSHVPAPLLLSSSTHSAAGSSFRLARSSTQPLQSPRVVHLAAQGVGTPPSSISTNSSHSLARQHSVSDSASLSERLTLSVGNDSEHIFEMSGLDNDSAIQSLGDEASAASQSSGAGVVRSSSVRARANMFQQLQEQSRSRREAAGREQLPSQSCSFANSQATSRHSPPPSATVDSVASHSSPFNDEPSTPNMTQDAADADFEPSSLSLAERLAFFSSLCEGAACGSGGLTVATGSARLSSRGSSCASRSPPYASMERTPRSSTAGSSTSVTPTPMEYSPIIHDLKMPLDTEQKQEQKSDPELSSTQQHNGFHHLSRSATAPTAVTITIPLLDATAPASRRLRLRTVGKLVLPDTFLSDRSKSNNGHRNSCLARMQTLEDIHISMGVRTIGKVKSPFIEQQQQQMKQATPTDLCKSKSAKMDHKCMTHSHLHSNGASDSGDEAHGSDSGKENCAANQQKQQQQQLQQQESQTQQMSDMRRKLTHLTQITVQQKSSQTVNRRHTTELGGTSATGGPSSLRAANRSHVDERFAKYFGLDESYNSTTTLLKTLSMPAKTQPQEAHNEHVRLPLPMQNNSTFGLGISVVQRRRDLLKRTRAMSLETTSSDGCISPTSMPSPKRAHSPANHLRTCNVASFEDILITADELHAAGHEFTRLCGEILGT